MHRADQRSNDGLHALYGSTYSNHSIIVSLPIHSSLQKSFCQICVVEGKRTYMYVCLVHVLYVYKLTEKFVRILSKSCEILENFPRCWKFLNFFSDGSFCWRKTFLMKNMMLNKAVTSSCGLWHTLILLVIPTIKIVVFFLEIRIFFY